MVMAPIALCILQTSDVMMIGKHLCNIEDKRNSNGDLKEVEDIMGIGISPNEEFYLHIEEIMNKNTSVKKDFTKVNICYEEVKTTGEKVPITQSSMDITQSHMDIMTDDCDTDDEKLVIDEEEFEVIAKNEQLTINENCLGNEISVEVTSNGNLSEKQPVLLDIDFHCAVEKDGCQVMQEDIDMPCTDRELLTEMHSSNVDIINVVDKYHESEKVNNVIIITSDGKTTISGQLEENKSSDDVINEVQCSVDAGKIEPEVQHINKEFVNEDVVCEYEVVKCSEHLSNLQSFVETIDLNKSSRMVKDILRLRILGKNRVLQTSIEEKRQLVNQQRCVPVAIGDDIKVNRKRKRSFQDGRWKKNQQQMTSSTFTDHSIFRLLAKETRPTKQFLCQIPTSYRSVFKTSNQRKQLIVENTTVVRQADGSFLAPRSAHEQPTLQFIYKREDAWLRDDYEDLLDDLIDAVNV